MKKILDRVPALGAVKRNLTHLLGSRPTAKPFRNSADYWEERYASGGNSGVGSYALFAEFKAEVLNLFVRENGVESVVEFGCGDGNQLSLARYPRYVGYDVSPKAVELCRERFASDTTKSFDLLPNYTGSKYDLSMSLDVIFHLVEDSVFENHVRTVFSASSRYVIVYTSDTERDEGVPHVRHRRVPSWIEKNIPGWKLSRHVPNRYPYRGDYKAGSFADFYMYEQV